MNSWWLNLYTIPHLKKLLLAYGIAIVSVCIGFMYFPSKVLIFAGAYIFPFAAFIEPSMNGMVVNLDFHKMSVPMKQLRKAFYLDLTIQITSFLVLGMISLAIPYFAFFTPQSIPIVKFLLAMTPSVFLFGSFSLISFLLSLKTMKLKVNAQKQQIKTEFDPAKKKKIIIFGLLGMSYVFFVDDPGAIQQHQESYFDQFMTVFNIGVMFIAFMFAGIFVFSKKAFNMVRENQIRKTTLNFVGAGGFAIVFCLMCANMVKFEINSEFYSIGAKAKAIVFFSDFLPVLEPETVRELAVTGSFMSEEIFKNADPAIYQMPVEDFVPDKHLYSYLQYLKYGKPSSRNVVYIMNELEKSPEAKMWRDPYSYKELRFLLVKHHPDANKLPEHLIKEKVETRKRRGVASKKKSTTDQEEN